MIDHPPIPPNCGNFIERDGKVRFTTTGVFGGFPIVREKLLPGSVRTVACVARCAWLDEAERHRERLGSSWMLTDKDYCTAVNNAEAWRRWGETC